jgi:ABC-type branched-subunit amino acid transport system substrate-binding protein
MERSVVGAVVPLTGRYSLQGRQVRIGLELWARRSGARLVLADDGSDSARSAALFEEFVARRCRLVLPSYGGGATRAVAGRHPGGVVWNHGAAADDVQRLPGVVSLPTPASRYLAVVGLAVARLRPAAAVALVTSSGPFGRFARDGFAREAERLGLRLAGTFGFLDPPQRVVACSPNAVLACGPARREAEFFQSLGTRLPHALYGGVSPGLSIFPGLLRGDPEGFLAPVQWHPEIPAAADLGPNSAEVMADARASGYSEIDYVAAQAYAAALVADHCLELDPHDPLSTARRLRTSTFFGAFELDPRLGFQRDTGSRSSAGGAVGESCCSRRRMSRRNSRRANAAEVKRPWAAPYTRESG